MYIELLNPDSIPHLINLDHIVMIIPAKLKVRPNGGSRKYTEVDGVIIQYYEETRLISGKFYGKTYRQVKNTVYGLFEDTNELPATTVEPIKE
jgi:hypothetical protein